MFFSIALLIVIILLAFKIAPVEKEESAHIHGAGQIGLLAALALFGVDEHALAVNSGELKRNDFRYPQLAA